MQNNKNNIYMWSESSSKLPRIAIDIYLKLSIAAFKYQWMSEMIVQ